MTAPKLTWRQQYLIYKRLHEGENTTVGRISLAVEFGVSETMIRRIAKKDPEDLLMKAGIMDKKDPEKPNDGLKLGLESDFMDWIKKENPDTPPKPTFTTHVSLAPLGVVMEPVGLARKYGTLQSVTADGAIIVHDSDGKAIEVRSCPVYAITSRGTRTLTRDIVKITEIKGASVRGEVQRWSGETIPGDLIFNGVGNTVTRVEFHPDRLPDKYKDIAGGR